MGCVYDAEHLGLSRQVAIKVLSPSQAKKRVAVKRFQQEARAAGAIGHPNICEVYDLGQLDDGSPYLVMERLTGQTLAERIQKEGGLPFPDIVEIMVQVLSGLVAAHEKGIIHRDIKPENIFLARRVGAVPIIKLLDFGVSKMLPEFQTSEDALDLTRTGMVMGTPYYMSPEQARGERNLDGRVDVYACGVVLYEAIAGKRPFLAPNYNALLLAIINTNPRPLRDVRPNTPPELEAIIQHAMAKNRNDRYASAKLFLRDLQPPPAESSQNRLPPPPTAEERARAQQLGGQPRMRRDTGPTDPRSRRIPEAPPSRPLPPPSRPSVVSDSIEIPIDIVVDDNDATEIYQPKQHRRPTPRWTEQDPRRAAPPAPRSNRHLDVPPAPPEPNPPYIDEAPTEIPPGRSSRRNFNPDETVKLTKTGEETYSERRSPRRR
jgi:serine/threonine-protein kinase